MSLELPTSVDSVRLGILNLCRRCPSQHWWTVPSVSVLPLPTSVTVYVLALSTCAIDVRLGTANQHRRARLGAVNQCRQCPFLHYQPASTVSVLALSTSVAGAGVRLSTLNLCRRCPLWHCQPVSPVSVLALSTSEHCVRFGTVKQCRRCPSWLSQPVSMASVLAL